MVKPVFAYILLLISLVLVTDAALESTMSRESIGIWLGAFLALSVFAVAVYFARRPKRVLDATARIRAAVSLLLVLALVLGASTIIDPSLQSGIRLMTAGTGLILQIVCGLLVATTLAGVASRSRWPTWLRIVLFVIGIYCIVVFVTLPRVTGDVSYGSLPDLFARLPLWAKGIPAAGLLIALVAIWLGGIMIWCRRATYESALGSTILLLLVPVLATAIGFTVGQHDPGTSETVFTAANEGASSRNSLRLAVQRLDKAVAEFPRETVDLDAAIKLAGRTPQDISVWIRENTLVTPYVGTLKGSSGVLMDRRGNSLDRSLLLQAMLARIGFETRLARVQLEQDEARSLVSGNRRAVDDLIAQIENVRTTGYNVEGELHGLVAELESRARKISDELMATLGDMAATRDAHAVASIPPGILDHWWIQYREEQSWVDIDPAVAGGLRAWSGEPKYYDVDRIPQSLGHDVTLSLKIETPFHGETTLLEHRFVSTTDWPKVFEVYQFPMSLPNYSTDEISALAAEDVRQLLLQETDWLPVLFVDGEPQTGPDSKFFDVNGDIFDTADMNPDATRLGSTIARQTAAKVESATSVFDSLLSDESTTEAPTRSIDEWLEITVHGPNGSPVTERRQISRITPAGDLDRLSLYFRTSGLLLSSDLSAAYLANRVADNVRATQAELVQLTAEQPAQKSDTSYPTFPIALAEFAFARRHASDAMDSWISSPAIYATTASLRQSSSSDVIVRYGLDIVHRGDGYWSPDGDGFSNRVFQGVFDTLLESRLIQGPGTVRNVALEFESRDEAWQTITTADALAGLHVRSDLKAMLSDEIAVGYILLAPDTVSESAEGSYYGWWRINPVTGVTIGKDSEFGGSAFFEWVVKNWSYTREQVTNFRMFLCSVTGSYGLSSAILASIPPPSPLSTGSACPGYLSSNQETARAMAKIAACMVAAGTFGGVQGSTSYVIGAGLGLSNFLEYFMHAGANAYVKSTCN